MAWLKEEMLAILVLVILSRSCNAAIYKVGDSAGWTLIGNVNYSAWASSKTFQVGDTLVFEYDPQYHNVLEVSRSNFHICDATAVISTHTTGNDSITILSPGHYYYICGFAGHCQTGQKVDIRVPGPPVTLADYPRDPIESPTQVLTISEGPESSPIGLMSSFYCNGSISRRFYGPMVLLLILTCLCV